MGITNEQRKKIISINVKTLIEVKSGNITKKAISIGMSRATLYKIIREGNMSDKSRILMAGYFEKDISWFTTDHANQYTDYGMQSLNNKSKTDNNKEEETPLQDDSSTIPDSIHKTMESLMDEIKKGYEKNNGNNGDSTTSQQQNKKGFNMYNTYFHITINKK